MQPRVGTASAVELLGGRRSGGQIVDVLFATAWISTNPCTSRSSAQSCVCIHVERPRSEASGPSRLKILETFQVCSGRAAEPGNRDPTNPVPAYRRSTRRSCQTLISLFQIKEEGPLNTQTPGLPSRPKLHVELIRWCRLPSRRSLSILFSSVASKDLFAAASIKSRSLDVICLLQCSTLRHMPNCQTGQNLRLRQIDNALCEASALDIGQCRGCNAKGMYIIPGLVSGICFP